MGLDVGENRKTLLGCVVGRLSSNSSALNSSPIDDSSELWRLERAAVQQQRPLTATTGCRPQGRPLNIDLDATETLHSVAYRVGRWYTAAPAARGRRNRPSRHICSPGTASPTDVSDRCRNSVYGAPQSSSESAALLVSDAARPARTVASGWRAQIDVARQQHTTCTCCTGRSTAAGLLVAATPNDELSVPCARRTNCAASPGEQSAR